MVVAPVYVLVPPKVMFPAPAVVTPNALPPSPMAPLIITDLPATVVPTPLVRVRFPVRVIGPLSVKDVSVAAVGKVVSAVTEVALEIVVAEVAFERSVPPANVRVPVPKCCVAAVLCGTEIDPKASVVPPEYVETALGTHCPNPDPIVNEAAVVRSEMIPFT